jgi:hypothetical protein
MQNAAWTFAGRVSFSAHHLVALDKLLVYNFSAPVRNMMFIRTINATMASGSTRGDSNTLHHKRSAQQNLSPPHRQTES